MASFTALELTNLPHLLQRQMTRPSPAPPIEMPSATLMPAMYAETIPGT